MNHFTVLKLSFACLIFSLFGCEEQGAESYIKEGAVLFEKGDLESARVQFQNALQIDPKLADAYYYMALIREEKLEWGGLLGNLLEAIAIDPTHLDAQIKLGQVYLSGGKLEKASEQVQKVIQLSPDNITVMLLDASVKLRGGLYAESLQIVDKILTKQPLMVDALGLKANILLAEHRDDEAITILNTAVEHYPNDRGLRSLRIRLQVDKDNYEGVIKDYEELIDLYPQDNALPSELADLLVTNGRGTDAEKVMWKAINAQPLEIELKLKLIRLVKDRDNEQVEKLLKGFIVQMPNNALFKFMLVDYYIAKQQFSKAEFVLQTILAMEDAKNKISDVKVKLAEIALLQQNVTQVESLAEEVLGIDVDHSDALMLRAGTRLNRGEIDGATSDLRLLLHNRPGFEPAMLLQAQISVLKGEAEVAVSQWRKILEINPNNLAALVSVLNQLATRGDYDEAERLLFKTDEAIKNEPRMLETLIQLKAYKKDWEGAKAVIEKLKAVSQANSQAKYWEGFLLVRQGQNLQAEKIYQNILVSDPEYLQALVALSQLYESRRRRPDLIDFLKRFTTKNPTLASALDILASAYIADQQWIDAEKVLLKASELNSADMGLKLKLISVIQQLSGARAETALRGFIQDHPGEATLKFRLAAYYSDQKRYSEVEALLTPLQSEVQAEKVRLQAQMALAQLAWNKKELTKARNILDKTISDNSKIAQRDVLMLRANVLMAQGEGNGALVDLQTVLESRPDFEPALLLLTQVYQKRTNRQELIVYLKSLLWKKPGSVTISRFLVLAYASDKHWIEAENLLQGLLRDTPKDEQLYILLARVYGWQQKIEQAEKVYQDGYVKLAGNTLQLLIDQASFYVFNKDASKAIKVYEKLLEVFPENDVAANNLADLLVTYQADYKESINRASLLVERFKDTKNPDIQDTYGWVVLKTGDSAKALNILKKAAAKIQKGARVHYHLAEAYRQQRDIKSAIMTLEKSLALSVEQGDFPEIGAARKLLRQLKASFANGVS